MTNSAEAPPPRKSYNHACLIARALDVLGDRWTLLILRDMMSGLQRYSDILESCEGISPNLLSARLKRLEADGLVERHYFKGLPPRVEYTLTEKGWAVRPVLLSLIEWSADWVGRLGPEDVGEHVTTDFAVRVLPTFSFDPERAANLAATMTIEISDCGEGRHGNCWSFDVHDGHLHPRRAAAGEADALLRTDTAGFFRFVRCEADARECGELEGDAAVAAAIQSCFQRD